jgi:hypothetical protein
MSSAFCAGVARARSSSFSANVTEKARMPETNGKEVLPQVFQFLVVK